LRRAGEGGLGPVGVTGRREAEEGELPRCRPVHEPVPRGLVAADDPGHPLAPLGAAGTNRGRITNPFACHSRTRAAEVHRSSLAGGSPPPQPSFAGWPGSQGRAGTHDVQRTSATLTVDNSKKRGYRTGRGSTRRRHGPSVRLGDPDLARGRPAQGTGWPRRGQQRAALLAARASSRRQGRGVGSTYDNSKKH
jgi:hypothetical protein